MSVFIRNEWIVFHASRFACQEVCCVVACVCVLWLACSLACGHSSVGAGVPK